MQGGCTEDPPGQQGGRQLPPRGTRKEHKRPVANERPAPRSPAPPRPRTPPRAPPPHGALRPLGPCSKSAPAPPLPYAARASEPRLGTARASAFTSPPRCPGSRSGLSATPSVYACAAALLRSRDSSRRKPGLSLLSVSLRVGVLFLKHLQNRR